MIENKISEKAILSAFIKDKNIREDYLLDVKKDYFFTLFHQRVYDVLFDFYYQKKDITDDTLMSYFTAKEELKQLEDILFTAQAMPSTIEHHIYNIKKAYINRKILSKAKLIEERIKNNEPVDIQTLFDDIETDDTNFKLKGLSELVSNYEQQLEIMKNNSVATGIPKIDRMLITSPGDLIVVGARPSMGKTAFTLSIALEKARKGIGSFYFSLEMPEEKMTGRALANIGGISMFEINRGEFSRKDSYSNAKKGFIELDNLFGIIDSISNVDDICSMITKIRAQNPKIEDFFIDHLGFIGTSMTFRSVHEQIGYITKKLKKTARATGAKIWLLSQLSRSIEKRDDKRPGLSDLRESGSIEEDADAIIGLYRDSYYTSRKSQEKEPNPNPMEILVLKQRDGATGTIEVMFDGERMKVTDSAVQVVDYMSEPQINTDNIPLSGAIEVVEMKNEPEPKIKTETEPIIQQENFVFNSEEEIDKVLSANIDMPSIV